MPVISVVFNADTGTYVTNVQNASAATTRKAEAVATAKNRIVDAFASEAKAAQELGASAQQLEAMQTRALQRLSSVTEDNAAKINASLDRIAEKQRKIAAEAANLKLVAPLPAPLPETHEVSDRMAASAAVRGLDTGNPGIRSVENFLITIPGVSKAVQGLFPLIGAAGLAGLFFQMGEAGTTAFMKVQRAAEDTKAAYAVLHDKSAVLIDDKEIENQKIQDQIDKLSGHPNNGLASALLEAKQMADKLVVSLQEDRKQLEALFKEHDTGAFGATLAFVGLGAQTTGTQDKELLKDQKTLMKQVHDAKEDLQKELDADPSNSDAATKKFNERIRGFFQSQINTYKIESARLAKEQADSEASVVDVAVAGGGGTAIDNSDKINNIDGRIDQLRDLQKISTVDESITSGRKQLGQVKQDRGDDAAARKAAEAQRNQWDIEHDLFEQATQRTAADEVAFWTAKVNAVGVGSLNYKTALDKQTEAIKTLRTKSAEDEKKAIAEAFKSQRTEWDEEHDAWVQAGHRTAADEAQFWIGKLGEAELGSENYKAALKHVADSLLANQREQEAADKARSKASVLQAQQSAAFKLATVAIEEQTGQISRHDAVIQTANIHAEEYRQQMVELQNELKRQTDLDPKSAASVNAQTAIDTAAANRRVQVMQDAANAAATTWQGALKNANAVWVQDAQDSAKQVVQFYNQALNGLNSNLADLMTGSKTDFSGMFKDLSKTLASDSLKHLEAPILGAFGIGGKADGSEDSPWWVQIKGGKGASAGGMAKFGNVGDDGDDSGDDDDDDGDSGGFGGLLHKAAGFLGGLFGGHKALGGSVQAGVTYDVGEMGREEFTPAVDGTITPHDKVDGGSAATYIVQVANGVTPEQMNMHVRAALQQYHQNIMPAGARAAVSDGAGRAPKR